MPKERIEHADAESFKDAMSHWASGVAVAAVRDPDGGRVYATTATAFASASLKPPLVLLGLGAGAQVLPFLDRHARFGISILSASQRRYATIFADPFPVGATPFAASGTPLLPNALTGLECSVHDLVPAGDHRLVLGLVLAVRPGPAEPPLIHYRRAYTPLV